jgi:hypothetical protein
MHLLWDSIFFKEATPYNRGCIRREQQLYRGASRESSISHWPSCASVYS